MTRFSLSKTPNDSLGSSPRRCVASAVVCCAAATCLILPAGAAEGIVFDRDVRPILSDVCYQCHGPDKEQRQADLRLDQRDGLLSDAGGGPMVVAGHPEKSELIRRIQSDDPDERMPPPDANVLLSEQQKQTLVEWVRGGAEWSSHWAFSVPESGQPPETENTSWPRNEIDRFVLAKLEQNHLEPSAEASRERLLRRVTLDLTGLPPTPQQIDDFLSDRSPGAYERVVERLLSSHACAERLALDWMDLSRYADSHGMHADGWRMMWPWRDWVIDAFHRNMPYDQFVTWQLAGDLLNKATDQQVLATAFHRNHPMTAEGGVIDEEFRLYYVFDRVETTATAFMGLTIGCARCHDHKFDPISQKEYYQFAAFFNNVRELGMTGDDGNYGPLLPLPDARQRERLAELDALISALEADLDQMRNAMTLAGQPLDSISVPAGQHFPLDAYRSVESPKSKAAAENQTSVPSDASFEPVETGQGQQKAERRIDGNRAITTNHSIPPTLVEAVNGQGVLIDTEYSYLSIKDAGRFDSSDPFSAAVWVRPDQPLSKVSAGELRTLLGNAGQKNQLWRGWELDLDSDNRLTLRLIHQLPEDLIDVRSKASLTVGQWSHVAFSYDGSVVAGGVSLFINGKRVESIVLADRLTKSIYPVRHAVGFPRDEKREIRVGRSYRAFGGQFGIFLGAVDDIRLFPDKITQLELGLLYDSYDVQATEPTEYVVASTAAEIAAEHRWQRQHEPNRVLRAELAKARKERVALRSELPEVMVLSEMEQPRQTHVLMRGEYTQPADVVQPATPAAVLPFSDQLPANRLGLARWLFDEDNGLTARVAANHYWQLVFGNGLVRTPHDFGVQGERPTHPKLLDHLAVSFRDSGWNVRSLLKRMVLSSTYRQSSVVRPELQQIDPQNRWLGRSPTYRWPAEVIRDQALAASGLLVDKVGGPSVKPYQPDGLWKEKNNFSKYLLKYEADQGKKLYRRSLYTFIRRTSPPPSMIALDAPNRSVCTVKREITNTPLQALVLMNDPQFVEAARVLAQRAKSEAGSSTVDQIDVAFRLLTSRHPSAKELKILEQLYDQQRQRYQSDTDSAMELLSVGESPVDDDLDPVSTAALAIVTNMIMNFDEFYMKR